MRKLLLGLAAGAMTFTTVAGTAQAQPRYYYYHHHRYACHAERRRAGNEGTALGAVSGGVLGGVIGHGLVGGLVGAGVGAVAGHAIAKSRVHC